jgi:hypothetical protein
MTNKPVPAKAKTITSPDGVSYSVWNDKGHCMVHIADPLEPVTFEFDVDAAKDALGTMGAARAEGDKVAEAVAPVRGTIAGVLATRKNAGQTILDNVEVGFILYLAEKVGF